MALHGPINSNKVATTKTRWNRKRWRQSSMVFSLCSFFFLILHLLHRTWPWRVVHIILPIAIMHDWPKRLHVFMQKTKKKLFMLIGEPPNLFKLSFMLTHSTFGDTNFEVWDGFESWKHAEHLKERRIDREWHLDRVCLCVGTASHSQHCF